MNKITLITSLVLTSIILFACNGIEDLEKRVSKAESRIKAAEVQMSNLNKQIRTFNLLETVIFERISHVVFAHV